ncbi:MAG: DNA repair protein RadC [Synergistaceae bacterium]|nr:DNA repair protein RadC [Synergistaceae bacterium]
MTVAPLAIPQSERPRERLLSQGPGALSLRELLAILLRTGCCDRDVFTVAEGLLRDFGGLEGLARVTAAELLAVKGLGEAKTATLLAALELARRLRAEALREEGSPSWRGRLAWWASELADESREYVVALFLDGRERLLGEERLSYGGLNGAYVDMSFLLRRAVRIGAEGVVLLHNHPDGSLAGSADDQALTLALKRRLALLDMQLLEHFVVAGGAYRPLGTD